jgi:hypothetical protein
MSLSQLTHASPWFQSLCTLHSLPIAGCKSSPTIKCTVITKASSPHDPVQIMYLLWTTVSSSTKWEFFCHCPHLRVPFFPHKDTRNEIVERNEQSNVLHAVCLVSSTPKLHLPTSKAIQKKRKKNWPDVKRPSRPYGIAQGTPRGSHHNADQQATSQEQLQSWSQRMNLVSKSLVWLAINNKLKMQEH